ncbi:MAG: hypothetical protein PHV34_15445 [Verrucomicrobiae bacterium]|nr:hypothetical protein [Verrucomicrobiae bacterium]
MSRQNTRTVQEIKRSAFSILELMTVMGIMFVLMAIAVPVLNVKSNSVRRGASQVANILLLARAKAVTTRNHTRVVFFTNDCGRVDGWVSYAVLMSTNRTSDEAQSWVYLDNCQHLPKGSFFALLPGQQADMPCPDNISASMMLPCVEFTPTGSACEPCDIKIQEGVVRESLVIQRNTNNTLVVRIDEIIGKAKILQ